MFDFYHINLYPFLVDVDNVYENPDDEIKHARPSPSTLTSRKKGKHVSSWTIKEDFTFRISAISRLNCDVNRPVEVVYSNIECSRITMNLPGNFFSLVFKI